MRVARRDKKVRFHYSLCARRDGSRGPAGRFHASFKMIKHYDRFIGGHDSTVNHRRKRATAREATRDPLTTRCHSRVPGRSPSVEASFPPPPPPPSTSLGTRRFSRCSWYPCARQARASSCERGFSRLSLQSGNCWIGASATGSEAIPDVTGVIEPVVVTIAHTSHVRDYYTSASIDESNYLAPRIISMALLTLRTSSGVGSIGSTGCPERGMRGIRAEDKHRRLAASSLPNAHISFAKCPARTRQSARPTRLTNCQSLTHSLLPRRRYKK